MKLRSIVACLAPVVVGACAAPTIEPTFAGDEAITSITNCVCYASVEGEQLKPWEFGWGDPANLRKRLSRCTCEADIDVRIVRDPQRYVTPGTVIK
ncbi:TPA: hypothetical protein QDC03_007344 [Burkholderia cepacia]|uniref:hypothetical protein n=1 Tax=Burkholderia cepacia TaxID=292 RepID=UPI0011B272EE|nr:hypothetical protein [Burkholderia cepacia]HDR9512092.1 hypothetical protein [Burkholderia cepacia]